MRRMEWPALRSAARQYAKRGALGASVGAIIGLLGGLRAASESGVPLANADLLRTAAFAGEIGGVAGVIYWRLRRLSERGGISYYLSWGVSVGAAAALVFLPEAIRTRAWLSLLWIVAAGFLGGMALAAYMVSILGDQQ